MIRTAGYPDGMSRAAFVLVKGGRLHRNPAFEDCNVDDAAVVNRYKDLASLPPRDRFTVCSKCQPLADELPDGKVGRDLDEPPTESLADMIQSHEEAKAARKAGPAPKTEAPIAETASEAE